MTHVLRARSPNPNVSVTDTEDTTALAGIAERKLCFEIYFLTAAYSAYSPLDSKP